MAIKPSRYKKGPFLGPNKSFPAPDKKHARAAARLAPRSEAAGNISPMTEARIEREAHAMLGPGYKHHAKRK